jgi:hypothetical protein
MSGDQEKKKQQARKEFLKSKQTANKRVKKGCIVAKKN